MLKQLRNTMLAARYSRPTLLVISLATLLLTGCMSAQTNLALYGQEQWSGVQAVTLSADFVSLMESEGTELSSELSPDSEGLDDWLQHAQAATDSANVNVSFNEVRGDDGSLSYVLQADGSQYALLNELMFQGQADISVAEVNGQRHVTIRYDASATTEGSQGTTSQADAEMSAEMLELFGISIATRISGGEIISHNADRVEGSTAIWDTPRLIEVTLTEAAQLDPATTMLTEPPASTGPSMATLLTAMEESAASSVGPPPGEGSVSLPDPTVAEPETATNGAPQQPSTTSEMVSQDSPPSTANATTQDTSLTTESTTVNEPGVAPAQAGQELPVSGAILPGHGSDTSFILSTFTLIALVGSGAATMLGSQKKRDDPANDNIEQ